MFQAKTTHHYEGGIMFIFKKIGVCLFAVLLLWQFNVSAQGVKMYSDNAPSAEEMGNILFSNQPVKKPAGIKMRSISFGKPKPAPSAAEQTTPVVAEQSSNSTIGLPIKFGYNSADVLSESKPFLNEIGRMLSLPNFKNERLVIEGHTDAGGSEEYNRYLSERRAESVKKYLRQNFDIASNRLFVSGMGESQPLKGVDPYASVHRRVQFRKAP